MHWTVTNILNPVSFIPVADPGFETRVVLLKNSCATRQNSKKKFGKMAIN